ncbi:bifunctional nicotinamide mononucleotide adenylyltransferase/ADP-ribose pyrophosphatase [Pragia fontium]|uniref:NUDIX hydrolase n=1 Tax=Pragia fontium TaxID=82985 RepID=UPI000DF95BE6|nr:NUDIX domain-containing protein [Pragia fontium]SUB84207.1 bifunctional nicotinamide mononucleotide adenylyltransferase/ADP-ribose pyrophosphatase [Pragia fontium]
MDKPCDRVPLSLLLAYSHYIGKHNFYRKWMIQTMYSSEQEYLNNYSIHHYDIPLLSIDIAIFTLIEGKLHILLVERGDYPFKGVWALPGGFIDKQQDQDLHACALRKLTEKTGVTAPHLEQVETIGNQTRDPRGWSVTSLYMALIPYSPTSEFVEAVTDARWWPYEQALELDLAFDHHQLIETARARLKNKTAYTILPIHVLNTPFTLTQLQQTFEELLEKRIEKKSFRRRILSADLLEEVGQGLPEGGLGRIAALYQPNSNCDKHTFVWSLT